MRLPTLLATTGLLVVASLGRTQVPPTPPKSVPLPPDPTPVVLVPTPRYLPTSPTSQPVLQLAALNFWQTLDAPTGPHPAPSQVPPAARPTTVRVILDPDDDEPVIYPHANPVAGRQSLPIQPVPPVPPLPLPQPRYAELSAPPKPPEPTVDQLIEMLEMLKGQKSLVEKHEQSVKDALAKKLAEQNERLKKLKVDPDERSLPRAPRVSKADAPSDKVLAAVGASEVVGPVVALSKGVRELKLDCGRCKRAKVGPSVGVCTSQQQAEAELGEVEGKAAWKQIDPKAEVLVVVGYNDTGVMPEYDLFEVHAVKTDEGPLYRFKHVVGDRSGDQKFTHLIGVEWPSRCKVYAVPKGSAVALD